MTYISTLQPVGDLRNDRKCHVSISIFSIFINLSMIGGNARTLAKARTEKKTKKKRDARRTPGERLRDQEIMRAKQRQYFERKENNGEGSKKTFAIKTTESEDLNDFNEKETQRLIDNSKDLDVCLSFNLERSLTKYNVSFNSRKTIFWCREMRYMTKKSSQYKVIHQIKAFLKTSGLLSLPGDVRTVPEIFVYTTRVPARVNLSLLRYCPYPRVA